MMPLIEPIEASVIAALVSKLIINNPRFWEFIGCSKPTLEPEPEHEKSSSNTTSANDAELVHIHHFDTWMHTCIFFPLK